MPRSPDSSEGPLFEEAVYWEEQTSDPSDEGRIQLVQDKGLMGFVDGIARPIGETRHAIWQTEVDEVDTDGPPGSPITGYRVIVGSSPTGAFVTHAGEIAQWTGLAWVFSTPRQGSVVYAKGQTVIYAQKAASSPWDWEPTNLLLNLDSGAEVQGQTVQTDGAGGIQLAAVVSGYPPAFATVDSVTLETTTLSTWSEKLSLVTPSLDIGSYIFFAQATMVGSKSNAQFEVRAQYDDTTDFGSLKAQAGLPFNEFQFFTHTIVSSISGVHTVDIDYRMASGSGYVGVKGAIITYWRVSGS